MKTKTIKSIGIIIFIFLIQTLTAQNTEQMRKWAFNGVEVDFTGSTVSTQTLSTPVAGANGAYASYYDENDQLVVRVVDNTVYDENNTIVDQLFDNPQSNYKLGDQMIIVPKSQSNNCEFYIFYSIAVDNYDYWEMRYALYNKGVREITANYTISLNNPYSTARVGNFTISDFIGTTNERRLYLVYFNSSSKSNDSIRMEYHKVTENTIRLQDVYTFETVASAIGELEIASDMSFLAYTSPTSYNYGILNFGKLNSNGTFDNNS